MRVISGHIAVSSQMLEQTKLSEDAFKELEWIALHYDEATDEQRARWDAFSEALNRREDAA